MNGEHLFLAIGELNDRFLLETDAALSRRSRRAWPSLLLTAVLVALLLAACGWAVHRMHVRMPSERSVYHVSAIDWTTGMERSEEISFQHSSMILHCDTEAGNYMHAFRPKLDTSESQVGVITFFYAVTQEPPTLKPGTFLVRYLDVGMSAEEALAQAGMSAAQAASWYTKYWIMPYGESVPTLMMELLDASMLYQNDLILGEFGGEAEIVSERKEEDREILEIQLKGKMTSRHLFLFEQEEQYLLHLSADADRYDFSDLEEIAAETEIKKTGLYVEYNNNGTDVYTLSDPERWLHTEKR